ncbi:liprin-beta-1-like isoform X5 [Lineus longissimus]|uniref:liprin-beta-1-like isoform X5 n=1 Tax=Lineus longissimus TaxID=88925 RepID=UPI00315CBF31
MANDHLEASQMLAAALEQMDGIIAGTLTHDISNGHTNGQTSTLPKSTTKVQIKRITNLVEDLKLLIETAENRSQLLHLLPQDTTGFVQELAKDLHQDHKITNGFSAENVDEKVHQLENEREQLVLQISVLTEQVEAQTEKIRELEDDAECSRDKLSSTEEMLQHELLSRTNLETHKLDLMADISSLKIRLTSAEKEGRDQQEKLHHAQRHIDDLTTKLTKRDSEITELKIKLAKNGTIPSQVSSQTADETAMSKLDNPESWRDSLAELTRTIEKEHTFDRLRRKHLEVEKLRKVVETLMISNEEKDAKITELQRHIRKVEEAFLHTPAKKATDILALLDDDRHSDTSSTPSVNSGSIRGLPNGDRYEHERHLMAPTATSTPDGHRLPYPGSIPSPSSTIHSSPIPHKSSIPSSESSGSLPGKIPQQNNQLKKPKTDDYNNGTYANGQDEASTVPRRKSNRFASFGKGFLKLRSSAGKRSTSAPNLAQSEKDEEDEAMRRLKDERAQQYKAMQSLPDGKKKKGIKKIFGKKSKSTSRLKRSNSDEDLDRAGQPSFVRGGIRSTAGPRLGWTVNNDLGVPFSRWDGDRVGAWLHALGLNMYVSACRKWVKNGEQLLKASPHDFEKELGMKHPLHRKKLHLALQAISAEQMDKMSDLDHNWVTQWLDDIGLPQYKDQFVEARVDGRVLHYLTVDDLLQLKVTNALHHISIKRGIQVLRLNNFNPNCFKRRPVRDEGPIHNSPEEVMLWTNHRVMDWLRSIDLSEYAPNMRGSGVHGALMVSDPAFTADLLASLLSIPSAKTLLRRHLKTHFVSLIGNEMQTKKREHEACESYMPLTPNMKIKSKKHGIFGHKRSKSETDFDIYVCPMDIQGPAGQNRVRNGVPAYAINSRENGSTDPSVKKREERAAKEIGAYSHEINTLTHMLAHENFLEDDNLPTSDV